MWYWETEASNSNPDFTEVDEVQIVGGGPYNEEPMYPDPGNLLPYDNIDDGTGIVCVVDDATDPLGYLFNHFMSELNEALEKLGGREPAWVLNARDAISTFDSGGKIRKDPSSDEWYDPATDSYWADLNGNGTPETNFRVIGGNIWVDTNFDGTFEHNIENPSF